MAMMSIWQSWKIHILLVYSLVDTLPVRTSTTAILFAAVISNGTRVTIGHYSHLIRGSCMYIFDYNTRPYWWKDYAILFPNCMLARAWYETINCINDICKLRLKGSVLSCLLKADRNWIIRALKDNKYSKLFFLEIKYRMKNMLCTFRYFSLVIIYILIIANWSLIVLKRRRAQFLMIFRFLFLFTFSSLGIFLKCDKFLFSKLWSLKSKETERLELFDSPTINSTNINLPFQYPINYVIF